MLRYIVASLPVIPESWVGTLVIRCGIYGILWHWDRFLFLVLVLSSVSVIPPMFHTRLGVPVVLSRRTNRLSLGTFEHRRAPN